MTWQSSNAAIIVKMRCSQLRNAPAPNLPDFQGTLDAGRNGDVPVLQLVVQGLQIFQIILRLLLHRLTAKLTHFALERVERKSLNVSLPLWLCQ